MTGPATATITKTAAGTGGGILLVTHLPLVAALATGLLFAIFLGVVLPAVWSTQSGEPTGGTAGGTPGDSLLTVRGVRFE
jgi:hypothetical protein